MQFMSFRHFSRIAAMLAACILCCPLASAEGSDPKKENWQFRTLRVPVGMGGDAGLSVSGPPTPQPGAPEKEWIE